MNDRAPHARRPAGLFFGAAVLLGALTGCVDLLGDFRPEGGGGSAGSSGGGGGGSAGAGGCSGSDCAGAGWVKAYGDADDQYVTGVAIDSKGNIIVTGGMSGMMDFGGGLLKSAGNTDAFVAKLDSQGSPLFSFRFGNLGVDYGQAVAVDADDNILIAGAFSATVDFGVEPHQSHGELDLFVSKLNPDGGFMWTKTFGEALDQVPKAIGIDGEGHVIVTGCIAGAADFGAGVVGSVANTNDVFVLDLSPGGDHVYSVVAGGYGDDCGKAVAVMPDRSVIVAGDYTAPFAFEGGAVLPNELGNNNDIFLLRLDSVGHHVWSNGHGDLYHQLTGDVMLAPDGKIALTATLQGSVKLEDGTTQTATDMTDPLLMMFDAATGTALSGTAIAEPKIQFVYGSAVDAQGNYFLTGTSTDKVSDTSLYDLYAAKVSPLGAVSWKETPAVISTPQVAVDVALDVDGAPVVVGNFAGSLVLNGRTLPGSGARDVFIARVNVGPPAPGKPQ